MSSRQAKPVNSPYYFPPPLRRQSQMPQRPVALLHRNSLTVGQRPSTFTGDPNSSCAAGAAVVSNYERSFPAGELQISALQIGPS